MIKIKYEPENNRAAAYDGEKVIGECTYYKSDKGWIADRTFVDSGYGGQGIAARLVAELSERARNQKIKIYPLCPFVKSEFEKKGEYADVWEK